MKGQRTSELGKWKSGAEHETNGRKERGLK